MNFKQLFQSFKNAWWGVKYVFKNEQNFRVQLFIAFLVILASFVLKISRAEYILIFLIIILIIILEFLNSAVEKFIDVLKPRLSFQIKAVKDIMAATVFLASLGSLGIGTIIFWPYLLRFLELYLK
ncbi:diacylglycerol kinase [Patescibacteria group bacterium]|nr:diacylglycerol kinase [Patescibacteria group bacterium]